MTKISDEDAKTTYGVYTDHDISETTGEIRFRLVLPCGTRYIRTLAPESGYWQNAHSHKLLSETYIIEKHWVVLAEMKAGDLSLKKYEAGSIFTVASGVAHNLFVSPKSVISTVKYGGSENDWCKEDVLDRISKMLTMDEVLKHASVIQKPEAYIDINTKYSAYARIYIALDRLLWRLPAFMVAVTSALLFLIRSDSDSSLRFIWDFPKVAGGIGLAIVVGAIAYSMKNVSLHHREMGRHLANMEAHGYFAFRQSFLSGKWPRAPKLIETLLWLVALLLVVWVGTKLL